MAIAWIQAISSLAAVTVEHFLDGVGPRNGFRKLRPGLEQGFHHGGIVA